MSGSAFFQGSFIALCLLLMAFPALRIIGMYLEHQISGLELFVYFGVAIAFVLGIMKTWGTSTSWLLGLLYVALCALYPLFEHVSNARALHRMDDEEIERCQRALVFDPKNAGALAKMGDIHYARGQVDEAIGCYQRSLDLWKDAHVKFQLQRAVQRKRVAETGVVVCYHCGTENPRGATRCSECGTAISGKTEVIEHLQSPEGRRTLLWAIGVSLGAGLLLAFVAAVPALVRNILFLFGFGGLLVYGWVRTRC